MGKGWTRQAGGGWGKGVRRSKGWGGAWGGDVKRELGRKTIFISPCSDILFFSFPVGFPFLNSPPFAFPFSPSPFLSLPLLPFSFPSPSPCLFLQSFGSRDEVGWGVGGGVGVVGEGEREDGEEKGEGDGSRRRVFPTIDILSASFKKKGLLIIGDPGIPPFRHLFFSLLLLFAPLLTFLPSLLLSSLLPYPFPIPYFPFYWSSIDSYFSLLLHLIFHFLCSCSVILLLLYTRFFLVFSFFLFFPNYFPFPYSS